MGTRALFVLALCGATAAAQELKRYENETKEFSLDFPAAWDVVTGKNESVVLLCDADVPGAGRIPIKLEMLKGPALTARAQAFTERPVQLKQWKAVSAEVGLDPLPHLVLEYMEDETPMIAAYAFKRRVCRVLSVRTHCTKEAWPKVKDGFLQAALSARCTLGRYPPVPGGYARTERDGLVYLTARGVKPSELKRIRNVVRATQKQFVKLHGPIVRPKDEPPLVFVHAQKEHARSLLARAATSRTGYDADHRTRRLFTIPLRVLNSPAHADLVFELHLLFFAEAYGEIHPSWARVGESTLLAMQAHTGKKPPVVTMGWSERFGHFTKRLDELESIYESDWTGYVDHSTAYALLFRHGPVKYRKAFQAFLKEYRATGNHEAASKRHIFRFDQLELMEDARVFLGRKVKSVSTAR